MLPRNAVNAAQPAQPKIAEIILLDVIHHVLAQSLLLREGEEPPLVLPRLPISTFCFLLSALFSPCGHKPVQAVLRAHPENPISVLMNPPRTVIVLAAVGFVGRESSILEAIQPAAISPKPHVPTPVLIDGARVTVRKPLVGGIAAPLLTIPAQHCGPDAKPYPALPILEQSLKVLPIPYFSRDGQHLPFPASETRQVRARPTYPHRVVPVGQEHPDPAPLPALLRGFHILHFPCSNAAEARGRPHPNRAVGALGDRLLVIAPQPLTPRIRSDPLRLQPEQPGRRPHPKIPFAIFQHAGDIQILGKLRRRKRLQPPLNQPVQASVAALDTTSDPDPAIAGPANPLLPGP